MATGAGEYQEQRGIWLRCYDSNGQLVPIKAEAEHWRAEAERQRAEAADAELARLKALLAQKGIVVETQEKPT